MIYLDNAATTLHKPASVFRAAMQAARSASSPGRGGHPWAVRAAEITFACRREAAAMFHVPDPEQVVLTFNATHGLNIAIRSLVSGGDRVVISGYEHNAVLRPLHALGAEICVAASPLFDRGAAIAAFEAALERPAAAVICTHVSNVFGNILPVREIAARCRAAGVPFVLDAAQSAGALEIDFAGLGAAFAAMPGHKGLYGPQGTGLLLCGAQAHPLLYGGTGSASESRDMPEFLPDRLEAGTHNTPGIAGLLAGMRFVRKETPARILSAERQLAERLTAGLRRMPDIVVFASDDPAERTGVVSFVSEKMGAEEIGAALAERGIGVRCGLHCAPLAHETAGTLRSGTVRISFSAFSRPDEVDELLHVLRGILRR